MNKIKYFLLALVAVAVVSCKDGNADYSDYLYITGALESTDVRMAFEGATSMGLTVSSTDKVSQKVEATFKAAPEKLAAYNEKLGASYVLPVDGAVAIENAKVVINAGSFQSTQAKLSVKDPSLFQEGVRYCLPIDVESDGNVLGTAKTIYVVFVPIITTKVANIAGTYYEIPGFRLNEEVGHLQQLTMECKVYVNQFQTANPYISSLMGLEENFLLRFGDVSCDNDQLQLAGGITGGQWDNPNNGGQKHPVTYDQHFPTGKWFHFACVYDGSEIKMYLDGSQIGDPVKATGTITLAWGYLSSAEQSIGPFAIGMSAGSRYLNGLVSEFRVWDVARNPSDLLENICYVDPTTPGLLAYWRFSGEDLQPDGTVLDLTGHGYNARPHGTAKWLENHKCPY